MQEDHVMVKFDFLNAYNWLQRRAMLLAVQQYSPDIYSYCYSVYTRPIHTFLMVNTWSYLKKVHILWGAVV